MTSRAPFAGLRSDRAANTQVRFLGRGLPSGHGMFQVRSADDIDLVSTGPLAMHFDGKSWHLLEAPPAQAVALTPRGQMAFLSSDTFYLRDRAGPLRATPIGGRVPRR